MNATGKRQTIVRLAIAALAGFIAGAFLVSAVVWRYGNVIGSRDASRRFPADPPAATDRWKDAEDEGAHGVLDAAPQPGLLPGAAATSPPAANADPPSSSASASSSTAETPTIGPAPAEPLEDLRRRGLEVPVEHVTRDALRNTFSEARGGSRTHEAIDILAPHHTPVVAVEDGTIARLFYSKAGGITIYQFDPTERYVYYYAHLERYADGLGEGQRVKRGEALGYVGTSGNAPKGTPHLHFAIFKLTGEKRWWEGTPIDPYTVLSK